MLFKIIITAQPKRLIVLLSILLASFQLKAQSKVVEKYIYPAKEWLDNKGKPINAHGGGILFYNGIYYWYGEHKIEGKAEKDFADGGIHCYTSKDLINWTDAGLVLSVENATTTSDLVYGCLIERPKVVHNKKTGKFIAYFKFYPKGNGYDVAYVGVAISESPAGPFKYSHKFLGGSSEKGSGDFSMFIDDDGSLYHLAVRKPDKVFVISKMREDYLLPVSEYEPSKGIELHTEAPAIIKIYGVYHLLGSGSTGWKPNTARHYTSSTIYGPWVDQGNPCTGTNAVDLIGSEKTFGGQSSFIFKVIGSKDAYIAMFDIWKPEQAIEGRYIWLPISMKQNKLSVNWMDKWNMEAFNQINPKRNEN